MKIKFGVILKKIWKIAWQKVKNGYLVESLLKYDGIGYPVIYG